MDGRMMGRGAPNRHVLLPLMRNIEIKGEEHKKLLDKDNSEHPSREWRKEDTQPE